MVSPHEGHIRPACCPVLARSIRWRKLRACDTAWRDSNETGGSATGFSATEAWRGPLSMMQRT